MNKLKYSFSSSDSEEDNDYVPQLAIAKSAVFKDPCKPANEEFSQSLDQSVGELDAEEKCLEPKMNPSKITIIENKSTKTIPYQAKGSKRPLTAAYTFKLKTPSTKRKKHDPVSLFQHTSTAWKKDKFLTSRADNKQGRKLELDKRNKFSKLTAMIL